MSRTLGTRPPATPARAAGLRGLQDQQQPALSRWLAAALIAAFYVLAFGSGIYSAFVVAVGGETPSAVDFSTARGQAYAVSQVGQIGAAAAVLFLITRWLGVPPTLAGLARRGPAWPALVTAVAAFLGANVAQIVLDAFTDPAVNTNQPLVSNGWAWLTLIDAVRAGVVEEIVLVAIPVLLLRRCGVHPGWVVAVCIALRWPFHVYHGLLATIPWVIVWAGVNAALYLWLRRLWPLIAVHILWDLHIELPALWSWATPALTIVMLGWLAWLISRQVQSMARQLTQPSWRCEPEVRAFFATAEQRSRRPLWVSAGAAASVGAAIWIAAAAVDRPNLAVVGQALVAAGALVPALVLPPILLTDLAVDRDAGGAIRSVLRHRHTYTGNIRIERIIGSPSDLLADLAGLARADAVTCLSGDAAAAIHVPSTDEEVREQLRHLQLSPGRLTKTYRVPLIALISRTR